MIDSIFNQAASIINRPTTPVVCDSVAGLNDEFDAARYMGTWYEIYHTQNQPFQSDDAKCVSALYSNLDASTGKFTVYNSSKGKNYGRRKGITGTGWCPEDELEGQCSVKFFFWQKWPEDPNYLIVDTDYETYSIVYSCDPDDMQYLWFLAREPAISDELDAELHAKAFMYLPNYETTNLIKDD